MTGAKYMTEFFYYFVILFTHLITYISSGNFIFKFNFMRFINHNICLKSFLFVTIFITNMVLLRA
jgi:hypothetical protein